MERPGRSLKCLVVLGAAVILAFACGVGMTRLLGKVETHSGHRYNQTDSAAMSELRRYVYLALPAQQAIDAHRKRTGGCPATIHELVAGTLPAHYLDECFGLGLATPQWQYLPESPEYQLYLKLGWDARLFYHSRSQTWEYDPGDGSASWPVQP